MEITRDNLLQLIKTGIKREQMSIAGLEKHAGVPKDTIRDFLRGKTQILRADKMQKVLRVLEPQQKVVVEGYVTEKSEIILSDEGLVGCPPGYDPFDLKALLIKGDGALPLFHDGWIVYYTLKSSAVLPPVTGGWQVPYNAKNHVPSGDTFAELLGKPCVIRLADGHAYLRTLKQGTKPDRYHLASYNSSDIENAEIISATKIVFIKT